MRMSDDARCKLDELVTDSGGDPFEVSEEYENQGICYECGYLQDCVEPDAEEYECEECGQHAVGGLTMALLEI